MVKAAHGVKQQSVRQAFPWQL